MPLLSPLYLERDPVSVIQGLFSFNLLYKLLPLYSLMRHFGFAAPQPRQSPDGSFLKIIYILLKRLLKLLPSNEAVQLRLRFTAPTFGASPHKKIDIWTLIFKWTWIYISLIYCRCTRSCGTSAPRCCASVASVARWLLPEKYKKSGERTNKFAPSPLFLYFSPHGSLFHAKKVPQCPILPGSCPPSTFGAGRLYFCVRYGNRCGPSAIITKLI